MHIDYIQLKEFHNVSIVVCTLKYFFGRYVRSKKNVALKKGYIHDNILFYFNQ